MCVPSYSVCLKGPQEKCVCCWHSPFNIVWIFHQDPSPVTRALCFQTCLYIPCVCACACVCVYRDIIDIYLPWNVTYCTFTPHYTFHPTITWFSSVFSATWKFRKVQQGISDPVLDFQLQTASLPASFVQGTLTQPWMQVSAGYRQSSVVGWGVVLCAWKKCTRLKILCPVVNASPLKTAGLGSCLHSAMYKLILSLCRYRVTTPPLLPPFVACFVQEPSRRQSQPHKKSSFWIHWPPMNSGNFLFGAFIHKSVLTHWVLSAQLKRFFTQRFLLHAIGHVLSNHPWR